MTDYHFSSPMNDAPSTLFHNSRWSSLSATMCALARMVCRFFTGQELNTKQEMNTFTDNIKNQQMQAVSDIISFLEDEQETTIGCLTESVKMKEEAAKHLLDLLENQALPLQYQGISVISVACIAEAISNEVSLQAAMMELYAHHLSQATHTPDILRAYQTISVRLTDKADSLLAPIRKKVEMAVNYAEIMEFAEGADVVRNRNNSFNQKNK